MKFYIILLALISLFLAVDPPIYNYAFHINFDEAVTVNKTVYRVNGQTFYDPKNNRERVDRANGRYDLFCGTVLPNVTTPCQQIAADNKRWIVFPQRSQCCFCCDGEHGCGILKPDWLADATYKGQEKIVDTSYDRWSKEGTFISNEGVFGSNDLWTTLDEQIPRRLDEGGAHVTDYNVHSFHNQTIPFAESIFALPTYCNVTTPVNCPLESFCGKLRRPALRTN